MVLIYICGKTTVALSTVPCRILLTCSAAYSATIWKSPLAVAMLLAADHRFVMGL